MGLENGLWEVYIIRTQDGKLYTGISTDVERRFAEHQSGKKGARFFHLSPPDKIVYREKVSGRSEALKRERKIKSMTKKEKNSLFF